MKKEATTATPPLFDATTHCLSSYLEIRRAMNDEFLNRWMGEALKLAQKAAEQDEIPIGCLIVGEDKMMAQGMNLREQSHKTTAHAEIVALESYNLAHKTWRLSEETWIFVTAEPCLMCTGALLWARAPRIVYGCSDPRQAGLNRVNPWIDQGVFDHRFKEVRGGVLEAECAQILKDYFKRKRVSAV
jgi:tRNA(adenine34) deaminase